MQLRKKVTCRICGSKNLIKILSFGNLAISGFFDEDTEGIVAPLTLALCDPNNGGCSLVQLAHVAIHPDLLYRQYWYKSGISQTMRDALKDVARRSEQYVNINDGDIVLDIGSNDGTLLDFYSDKLHKVGFEPSVNILNELQATNDTIINNYFNKKEFLAATNPNAKAKMITSIAMFYDLEDPHEFMRDLKEILAPDGVWVNQLSYLPLMLSQNAFDNTCFKPETIILGSNKQIKEIEINDFVINQRGMPVKVNKVFRRPYHGEMVTVSAKYLYPLVATPEHPLKVVKKEHIRFPGGQLKHNIKISKPVWSKALEIQRGDFLVLPLLKNTFKDDFMELTEFNMTESPNYRRGLKQLPINKDTAWLMGLYVAEGHVGRTKVGNQTVHFTLNRKEVLLAEKIQSIVKKLNYRTQIALKERNNTLDVSFCCTALARAFHEWFGKRASLKKMPGFILDSKKNIKISFLRGLFVGDGYIKANKVHFHTSSLVLAQQVQLLVASLGGMLGVSYVKPYPRVIRGGSFISKDSWQLRGSSKALSKIFDYNHIGPNVQHVIIGKDHILIPVKKVDREIYNGDVYNLETEDHTYLVSNAVVHNCHEHIEYYSLTSMQKLLKKYNLECVDVELNDVNGGSFRMYIAHIGAKGINIPEGGAKRVAELLEREKQQELTKKETYVAFAKRVKEIRSRTRKVIRSVIKNGGSVFVYGASTKGNTLLQYFGLDHTMITAAADANPAKWGKKTVATNIPIISVEEALKINPTYFLVLPWHFKDEFLAILHDYLMNGGKVIFPLPEFEIITRETLPNNEVPSLSIH